MSHFTRWASVKHSEGARILALIPAALVLLVFLPFVIVVVCPKLDGQLRLSVPGAGLAALLIGGLLAAAGMTLGLWSNYVQFTRGRGTPLPMMPTQALLTSGPYRYCRNPMTLGTILAYLGMSIAAATVTGTAFVLAIGGLLVLYLKQVEERELAERFGEDYLTYTREVPFIIPRISRGHRAT
jgi:protein-S-isoprenylcysteine O-methyltransferase Ste14